WHPPHLFNAVHGFDRHPLRESAHDSPEGSDVARGRDDEKALLRFDELNPVAGLDVQSLPYALRERDLTLTGQGCMPWLNHGSNSILPGQLEGADPLARSRRRTSFTRPFTIGPGVPGSIRSGFESGPLRHPSRPLQRLSKLLQRIGNALTGQ